MTILVEELIRRWREEAETIRRRYSADGLAALSETHARELELALRAPLDAELTISEAAAQSGYSRPHLRRLLDTGVLPNAGRRRAPRIRLGDLPAKPTHRARGGKDPLQRGVP